MAEISDKERLDFLDRCAARLNAAYGTSYTWELILNHNVNRLMLGQQHIDLNDAKARGLPSCRAAIDAEIRRVAAAASAVADEKIWSVGWGPPTSSPFPRV